MSKSYLDKLIGFHPDQLDIMDAIVARKHMSRSEFVRQAVNEKIERERNRENIAEVNANIDRMREEIATLKQQVFDLVTRF